MAQDGIVRGERHFTNRTLTRCRSTCSNSRKQDSPAETAVERDPQKPRASDARRDRAAPYGGCPAWPVRSPGLDAALAGETARQNTTLRTLSQLCLALRCRLGDLIEGRVSIKGLRRRRDP